MFVCKCLFLNLIALFILTPLDNGQTPFLSPQGSSPTTYTTMDPAKLAKLQAAAAANRIGELFTVYTRSFLLDFRGLVLNINTPFFLPFHEPQVERELCAEKLSGKLSPRRLRTTKSSKGRSKS
jgi:hypothetical protein